MFERNYWTPYFTSVWFSVTEYILSMYVATLPSILQSGSTGTYVSVGVENPKCLGLAIDLRCGTVVLKFCDNKSKNGFLANGLASERSICGL
jgi:hypothetical protein